MPLAHIATPNALLGQSAGDSLTEALAASGNDCNLTFEARVHVLIFLVNDPQLASVRTVPEGCQELNFRCVKQLAKAMTADKDQRIRCPLWCWGILGGRALTKTSNHDGALSHRGQEYPENEAARL